MNRWRAKPWIGFLVTLTLLSAICWFFKIGVLPTRNAGSQRDTGGLVATQVADDDRVSIGGVSRPRSDVQSIPVQQFDVPRKPEGAPPEVLPAANQRAADVKRALTTNKKPAAISSLLLPKAFDEAASKAQGRGYVNRYADSIEPGRAFESKQVAEGVSPLAAIGPRFHRMRQGETVRLQVKAEPEAPVTFTSLRFGQFDNELTSITVIADAQGKATTNFRASSGTREQVNVVAASPLSSGQVVFRVFVELPAAHGTARL